MANAETRIWRTKAHAAFDPLWKSGNMTRDNAYRMISEKLQRKIHIAESDVETCKDIIAFIKDRESIHARIN